MAASAIDTDITTVEGLATIETPNDIQQAFVTEGAVQCGFCTPGLIVAVHHLLETNSSPSEIEVKEALSGNICRCTGYGRIFSAVQLVISQREKSVS
jgi:carbon-monoxide dehydrogenase small subunit